MGYIFEENLGRYLKIIRLYHKDIDVYTLPVGKYSKHYTARQNIF